MKKFYITTTLPYVNADPHIGFALELIQADTLARFKRQQGYDVCFNTGTDEHGLKIYRKAIEKEKDPQAYCDEYAAKFDNLKKTLNVSYTNFIRTTNPYHKAAAQEFWKRCDKNGDIYKKNYQSKYCVGCELEKTDSELEKGKCLVHPNLTIEIIEEENYFFKFSNYQQKLLDLYKKNPSFVIPDFRLSEITKFVEGGLEDFSISRLKSKMPWGVSVPDDEDHVMYVWFDALINYISTIGWPHSAEDTRGKSGEFWSFWPVIQCAGKDNLRQQSAIWQAMLMSAGLPPSKQIFIHGFITSEGQKMSKSLGNVVNPLDLVSRFGVDAVRYYLLREIPSYGDGDFSERRFVEVYNADLANGLGNLISRVAKLCEGVLFKEEILRSAQDDSGSKFEMIGPSIKKYRFDEALGLIWNKIKELDQYINEKEPWKIKDNKLLTEMLQPAVDGLRQIGYELQPFLPGTAEKILKQFSGEKIAVLPPYFKRLP